MGSDVRRVVVVGAGSGIGAAAARWFHDRGDHVLAVDVRPQTGPAAEWLICDLRNGDEIEQTLTSIGDGWDVFAHVAGIPGTAAAADVLSVNYLGARLMLDGMLQRMNRGGSMVAVASTAALGWENNLEMLSRLLEVDDAASLHEWLSTQDPAMAYYVSKQALILYAKRLSGVAWREYGVRVNTISPGPTETPILGEFEQSMGKEMLDGVRATIGRHGTVDDMTPAIGFLTSPDARWINGQDIQVDGGFNAALMYPMPAQAGA
ncbi:SDR family oxidoreductase [Mycobacterium sp. pV006]|uniref:SDR family oxidoreductase n=1 Tax=Mycobacterium sp. pV006 TaxID=3238983 RepID=UPI00351B9831